MKQRALISVSDKTGILEVAKALNSLNIEIISTGNTSKFLNEQGISTTSIESITNMPEILGGRVKTLSPFVFGGILYRRNDVTHVQEISDANISSIDYVIVNLYPFVQTISKKNCSNEEAIEQIDIGGPSLLRAAAKNYQDVTVLVDPLDYGELMEQLRHHQKTTRDFRRKMATKVFQVTASYDAMIAQYLSEEFTPDTLTLTYQKVEELRYGENPHQSAAFYQTLLPENHSLAQCEQISGKQLSYNNYLDASSAIALMSEFDLPCAVAVKHTNPCGVALGKSLEEAFDKAYACDPVSIFGGIVALNREVTRACALAMKDIFLEVIVAPSFSEEALTILTAKKNLRLLKLPSLQYQDARISVASIPGGLLVQSLDQQNLIKEDCKVVTQEPLSEDVWSDVEFANAVVKHVKSNAIVIAKDLATVGIGCGQSNRVGAATLALSQAKTKAMGAILASDAFFPMADTVLLAASYGISTIVQPGGSLKDQDSIDACDQANICMIFTGLRHFKHS